MALYTSCLSASKVKFVQFLEKLESAIQEYGQEVTAKIRRFSIPKARQTELSIQGFARQLIRKEVKGLWKEGESFRRSRIYPRLVHSGVQAYTCSVPNCRAKFSEVKGRNRHERQSHSVDHRTSRPYPCLEPGCFKSYKYQGTLAVHQLRNH